jgi:hypothetical protein
MTKIEELARDAGLRFTQLMCYPLVPSVDGKQTDLEKFAELIVRHCIYKFGQTRTEPNLEKYIMDGLKNES